jgi:hypothetical protein
MVLYTGTSTVLDEFIDAAGGGFAVMDVKYFVTAVRKGLNEGPRKYSWSA